MAHNNSSYYGYKTPQSSYGAGAYSGSTAYGDYYSQYYSQTQYPQQYHDRGGYNYDYGNYYQQGYGQQGPPSKRGRQDQKYPVPNRGSMPGSYPSHGVKRSAPWEGRGGARGGRGRGGGGGGSGGAKRPRRDEAVQGKDDSLIPVDKTLIDKRFNIWNLPSKAKVLLVSNIPPEIAKLKPLFCLFSFYGDIPKIKILPKKGNAAFIEFATATMACIARDHMDQVKIKNKTLYVSFSKYHEIVQHPGEDQYVMDFSGPEYKLLQRYSKDELLSPNLKRICKPSACLHINNFPKGFSVNKCKEQLQQNGIIVTQAVGIRKAKEKDVSNPDTPSRAYIYVSFKDVSDAIIALALIGGTNVTPANPSGLRVSFAGCTVDEERKKNEKDKKMIVCGDDDLL